MHRFDTGTLMQQVSGLTHGARVAFALACAERVAASLPADPLPPHRALAEDVRALAHRFLAGERADAARTEALITALSDSPDLDEDALAPWLYVIECVHLNKARAALWAGMRAYDASERVARDASGIVPVSRDTQQQLLEHPVVQAEIAAQAADLQALVADPLAFRRLAGRTTGRQHV